MKENIRRLVLFVVIVGTGSVLIFVNIPLILMLPLIIAVGFFLLVILDSITVNDIKKAVPKLPLKNLRQLPVLKKLDSIELSGKKAEERKGPVEKKTGKIAPAGTKSGIKTHLSLLVSSVASFGKLLTEQRKKPAKNPEEINKLLEHTITEKVSRGSALESAATVPAATEPGTGGAGGALPAEKGMDADPFFSLSGEELETGLLDALDEPEPAVRPETSPESIGSDSGLSLPDLEMPALPDETAAGAEAILKMEADNGSDELKGLDGIEAVDETLGDLDSINLDDIDLEDGSSTLEAAPPVSAVPSAGPAPGSSSLIPATPITPAMGLESSADENQGDISSFAAGTATGTDDDMLSSLATDIKHVKKEKNVSLLRELKDFKAPATEIEKELSEMSEQLNTAGKSAKKKIPSHQGIK